MSRFTVIDNPSLQELTNSADTRPIETGQTLKLLQGRQFHMMVSNAPAAMPHLRVGYAGAILGGARALREVPNYKRQFPGIPVLAEPAALREHWATPDQLFVADPDSSTHSLRTLNEMLDFQRDQEADLAITPTGQIRAGEVKVLAAVIDAANELNRGDMIVAITADARWLSDMATTDQFIQEINRSRHPVLLSFAGRTKPLDSNVRINAFRKIVTESQVPVVAHRVGILGFEAISLGAVTSSIGSYPSVRQSSLAGTKITGTSGRQHWSPHMLVGDLLDFIPSTKMRQDWFAGVSPFTCSCLVCAGGSIDRLYATDDHRAFGHLHNVLEIDRVFAPLATGSLEDRRATWRNMVVDARKAYGQLAAHTGKKIAAPRHLALWSEPLSD